MKIAELEKLLEQAKALKEQGIDCEFSITDKDRYAVIEKSPKLDFRNFKVQNLTQAELIRDNHDKSYRATANLPWFKAAIDKHDADDKKKPLHTKKRVAQGGTVTHLQNISGLYKKGVFNHKEINIPSLRFFSENFRRYATGYNYLIDHDPLEFAEKDKSFRVILDDSLHPMITVNDKHPHYQYLDKGHFIFTTRNNWNFGGNVDAYNYMIVNELTPESLLVVALISHHATMIKYLPNEVFINAAQAKVVRLRIEKEIGQLPQWYTQMRNLLFGEYDKIMNDDLLGKIVNGSLAVGSYNNIKLTKTSASYEAIKVEAPDLLEKVMKQIPFDEGTDIYAVYRALVASELNVLDSIQMMAVSDEDIKAGKVKVFKETDLKEIPEQEKVDENPEEDDEGNLPDAAAEGGADKNDPYVEFSINGYAVRVSRSTKNTRRYINGRPIKIDELERVCYRASCCAKLEDFNNFVKAVSEMSLEWHDALAEGVRVKIQDGMTYQELKDPAAPLASPKIKFRRENGVIGIVINDTNEYVPVKFSKILKELKRINRQTNGNLNPSVGYGQKTPEWARYEIGKALKACCTFTEKQAVLDNDGNPVLVDGKPQFNKVEVCKISDEQARYVEKMAREYWLKAREKEKEFLRVAVEKTGAKLQEVQGEQYYIVEGLSKKQYAVHAVSNQVKAYPEMRHICIVEPGHVVSTGGDATAARLFALRNDKFMTSAITTLRS